MLVALLAGGGARVRRRVGGGRAGRARGTHPAAAPVDRAVQAVSVDLSGEGGISWVRMLLQCATTG